MKQLWKTIMTILSYVGGILIALGSETWLFIGNPTLNTKKIDCNIDKLLKFSWFNNLYEDEKYRRLFFASRKVRGFLQSSIRVNRMIKNEHAQNRFVALLDKQIQHRNTIRKKLY